MLIPIWMQWDLITYTYMIMMSLIFHTACPVSHLLILGGKGWKDKVGDLLKMVQGKIIEEKKVLLEKKKEEDLKLRREIYEAERRFRHQAAPDP